MSLPDWVQVGEQVGIQEVTHGAYPAFKGYDVETVERLTPTLVVLTSGRKFAIRRDLREIGGNSRLVDPRDDKVKRYRAKRLLKILADDIADRMSNSAKNNFSVVEDQQYITNRINRIMRQVDAIMK